MPNTADGKTQHVRLMKVPVTAIRVAKSKAALLGQTLDQFLTALITKALHKEKK